MIFNNVREAKDKASMKTTINSLTNLCKNAYDNGIPHTAFPTYLIENTQYVQHTEYNWDNGRFDFHDGSQMYYIVGSGLTQFWIYDPSDVKSEYTLGQELCLYCNLGSATFANNAYKVRFGELSVSHNTSSYNYSTYNQRYKSLYQ